MPDGDAGRRSRAEAPRIFISHTSERADFVRDFLTSPESAFRTRIKLPAGLDSYRLGKASVGSHYEENAKRIAAADIFVAVIDDYYGDKAACLDELKVALQQDSTRTSRRLVLGFLILSEGGTIGGIENAKPKATEEQKGRPRTAFWHRFRILVTLTCGNSLWTWLLLNSPSTSSMTRCEPLLMN